MVKKAKFDIKYCNGIYGIWDPPNPNRKDNKFINCDCVNCERFRNNWYFGETGIYFAKWIKIPKSNICKHYIELKH